MGWCATIQTRRINTCWPYFFGIIMKGSVVGGVWPRSTVPSPRCKSLRSLFLGQKEDDAKCLNAPTCISPDALKKERKTLSNQVMTFSHRCLYNVDHSKYRRPMKNMQNSCGLALRLRYQSHPYRMTTSYARPVTHVVSQINWYSFCLLYLFTDISWGLFFICIIITYSVIPIIQANIWLRGDW